MVKTNYSKVEEALAEGLRKLTMTRLLELADLAKKASLTETNSAQASDREAVASQHHLISSLQRDLKGLYKHGTAIHTTFGITKKELKKFITNPEDLTPQDWEKLKQLKIQIEAYKKEIEKNLPQVSDETIVEQERHKHLNKRFNVKDKWIPLK